MYGWSVLHCLPVGMADDPSVGTGTVMRAGTLRHYALEAGFRDVKISAHRQFLFPILSTRSVGLLTALIARIFIQEACHSERGTT